MKTPNNAVEFLFLGLLALLWGSSYLFIKIAVADIPPMTLIATRVAIAAIFLLSVMYWRGLRLPRDAHTWRMLLVMAMFNSIGAWTVLAWGQQFVDSGLASVLNSTSPIFVFFITYFVTRHEAANMRKLLGVCLGVIGIVVIVGPEVLEGFGQHVYGQLAALTGAFLYACAAIYGKNFTDLPATVTAAGTMIWASIFLIPLSLIVERPWTLNPSGQSITAAIILAVFCTGGALLIYFRLINTLGSMGVSSQSYLRAVVGVALGMVFLDEQISLMVGLGLLTAIVGVVIINLPTRRGKV